MSGKTSISTHHPSMDEALSLLRAGTPSGLFASDGSRSYAFLGNKPNGKIDVMVTSVSGRHRRQALNIDQIEFRASFSGWEFESEFDAYLKRERYVRLDPDTCAGIGLQVVHKCMRDPLEAIHDRISEPEMMAFIKASLNRVFTVLAHPFDPSYLTHLLEHLYVPKNWDPPVLSEGVDPWKDAWGGHRLVVSLKGPWRGNRSGLRGARQVSLTGR